MSQLKSLSNFKCIVTGGPTREWIDPVRFISNPSSGKMGIALADAANKICKETIFIHGPIDLFKIKEKKYKSIVVESTEEMLEKIIKELEDNCIIIMAAAPADYTPYKKEDQKIKKRDKDLILKLKRTPDILKTIVKYRKKNKLKNIITIGFAAETINVEEYGLKKLKEKDLDYICVNDVSQSGAGFNSDTNIISVYTRKTEKFMLPKATKTELAVEIMKIIETT